MCIMFSVGSQIFVEGNVIRICVLISIKKDENVGEMVAVKSLV